jgi:choline dehydrogenase-like flavoprotein
LTSNLEFRYSNDVSVGAVVSQICAQIHQSMRRKPGGQIVALKGSDRIMLIDGRTLPPDHVLESDLCIIGAGAAGITLALAFAGRRDTVVCLVESGGFEFDAEDQELYRGGTVGAPYEPYDTRLRYFGGSTNHWGGYCRPLEECDFEVRPWIPYSGWPIRRMDLAAYYDAAGDLCQIGAVELEPSIWAERLGLPILGLEAGRLRNLVFQVGPPTRFGEVYRERLLAAENLRICLNSNVVGFYRPAGAALVERVQVRTLAQTGFAITARCFVLACGGIENARLLLSSRRAADGLSDLPDLAGRFFMEHTHFNLGSFALAMRHRNVHAYLTESAARDGLRANLHLGVRPDVQAAEQLANVAVQLRPRVPSAGEKSLQRIWGSVSHGRYPDELTYHLQHVLADLGPISEVVGQKLAQRLFGADEHGPLLALRAVGEQVPNPDSRVMLADTTDALGLPKVLIDWRLSELDRITLRRAGEILAEEVGRLGLGRIQLAFAGEDGEEPDFIEWGFHHMGTTRMDDDPKQGVVDRNCRLHAAANLYVAGSSVFPTSGGGTPTITLVALALRLADHLKAEVFV